jgi:hypothetical protein
MNHCKGLCYMCFFFLFILLRTIFLGIWCRVYGIAFGVGLKVLIDFVNCVNVIVNIFSIFSHTMKRRIVFSCLKRHASVS